MTRCPRPKALRGASLRLPQHPCVVLLHAHRFSARSVHVSGHHASEMTGVVNASETGKVGVFRRQGGEQTVGCRTGEETEQRGGCHWTRTPTPRAFIKSGLYSL